MTPRRSYSRGTTFPVGYHSCSLWERGKRVTLDHKVEDRIAVDKGMCLLLDVTGERSHQYYFLYECGYVNIIIWALKLRTKGFNRIKGLTQDLIVFKQKCTGAGG